MNFILQSSRKQQHCMLLRLRPSRNASDSGRGGCASLVEHSLRTSAKGHRLNPQQRESGINRLLTADSELLRSALVEENALACAVFSIFPQRERKSRTAWRMAQSDANCSLSTCQLVDTHAAVDKRRLTLGAVDGKSRSLKRCYFTLAKIDPVRAAAP
jgi:hypothetical protein